MSSEETLSSKPQMASRVNNSGSTTEQRLSSLSAGETGHSTSKVLEELTTCNCGTPTKDGGKSSSITATTLLISITVRSWMFMVVEMLKDKMLLSGRDTMEQTKDGQLSMLIPLRDQEPQVLMDTSVSISTDHSTLSPTCG